MSRRSQSPNVGPRRASPFSGLQSAVAVAALYGMAAVVWIVWGSGLGGGRWLAVHLFTVGVLTNLVTAMTHHFAQTLLHAPGQPTFARLLVLNAGALLLLTGLPTGSRWLVVAGATTLTVAVLWLYVGLRRMRKTSLTARFAFVVRAYERACSAFIHGALLGALLGSGVLAGGWYASGRLAHLHVNVLGWGGITLLATVLFFGPTVMRARMEEGADAAGAVWLRRAATGLTVAALALLGTGVGGVWELPLRLLAAAGLGVYAVGAAKVCAPVIRTGQRAQPSLAGRMLQSACGWFVVVAAADALAVASGQLRLLDGLGAAMLVGVLGQGILAALTYLVPMAFARGADQRAGAQSLLGALPRLRALVLNAGVAVVLVTAALEHLADLQAAAPLRLGWALIAASIALHLILIGGVATGIRPAMLGVKGA